MRELRVSLAPPLLARIDPASGRPRKREYGPWVFGAMKLLARLRGLRGSALDPFGRTEERRAERRWVEDYERRIAALAAELDAPRVALATRIAAIAEQVRGFGPVKEAQMAKAGAQLVALDRDWQSAAETAAPGTDMKRASAAVG